MRIGVVVPMAVSDGPGQMPTWPQVRAFGQHGEAVGLDSLWVCDHLLSGPPDEGIHEGWTILAALAASPHSVELGQLVTCLSPRIGRTCAFSRPWSHSIPLLAYWSVRCHAAGSSAGYTGARPVVTSTRRTLVEPMACWNRWAASASRRVETNTSITSPNWIGWCSNTYP
jgi:Luciferase-like monooxygenase